MSGAELQHPLYVFMACKGTTLDFSLSLSLSLTHINTHLLLSSLLIGYQMNRSQCKEHHYLLNCPMMSLFLIISVLGRAIARMSSVTLQTVIILQQLITMLHIKYYELLEVNKLPSMLNDKENTS